MRLVFQNIVFHEILAPPIDLNVFSHQLAPPNDPKLTQEAPRSILFMCLFSTSILGRFWCHFGSPNASLLAPFSVPKSLPETIIFSSPKKIAPRAPQDAPRGAPERPKRRPEAPKGSPRAILGAKIGHLGAQEAPKMLQKASKRAQVDPKRRQRNERTRMSARTSLDTNAYKAQHQIHFISFLKT